MGLRKMNITVGCCVWVSTPTGRDVAPGWEKGHEAVAIQRHDDRPIPEVTIRDADGREITVAHFDLLAGYEFEGMTGWVPEMDPRVLDHCEAQIRKYRAQRWQEAAETDRRATIRMLEDVLRRNGRNAPPEEIDHEWRHGVSKS